MLEEFEQRTREWKADREAREVRHRLLLQSNSREEHLHMWYGMQVWLDLLSSKQQVANCGLTPHSLPQTTSSSINLSSL